MIQRRKLAIILLLASITIPVGGPHPYVWREIEASAQGIPPTCTHVFQSVHGLVNVSAQNSVGGELLVVAYSSSINHTSGHILFFDTTNTAIWWSQEPGVQNYGFEANRGVAGYMSCSDGYSNYLIHAASGHSHYTFNDSLGQLVLVLLAICTLNPPSWVPLVDGAPMSLAYNYSSSGLTLSLYAGLFSTEPNQTVVIDAPSPHSYVFVFSVSTNPYGKVVGTVTPRGALVSVNGTPIPVENGVINITLRYGTYEFGFNAPHHLNLSIVVEVYGGMTTPLSVSLVSLSQARLKVVTSLLTRVMEALIIVAAIYMGWASYTRFEPGNHSQNKSNRQQTP